MTGVIDRRRFFDRKDMDQARMVAAGLQNLSHPIFLPKVLPHNHFDLQAVLPREPDDVIPHLTGNRLRKPRQIPRAKPRPFHRNQQRSRMRHVDQGPMQDYPVKTPQFTGQFIEVASHKIGGSFWLQWARWLSKCGHAPKYHPLWFWLRQVRISAPPQDLPVRLSAKPECCSVFASHTQHATRSASRSSQRTGCAF